LSENSVAQIYNTQIDAKINLKSNTEFIEITGSAYNKTQLNESLRYELSVIKNEPGKQNSSKNEQSGRIVLAPGDKQNLSKTTINTSDTSRMIILLLVYNLDNKLLGLDRVVINATEEDKNLAAKASNVRVFLAGETVQDEDDGVFLKGIVIEDTKTKPGRDFYNLFYLEYRNKNINGEKIVTIKETLSLANNTKIEILVGDVNILEFFVRPQGNYLEDLSDEAIRRVNIYFDNLRAGKYIVNHY
jgi:hypothetical protein